MPAITIYLDDETARLVRTEAKRQKKSVSTWVKERLGGGQTDAKGWPEGFLDRTFGALSHVRDFARPHQGSEGAVAPLEL